MNDAFLHGDAAQRKQAPMAEGLLWYFPNALAAVANLSKIGNDQHNPGQPMHHAVDKSTDHADCILRHLAHAGQLDKDGVRETTKVAWRALALLEKELRDAHNLPLPRNAWVSRDPLDVQMEAAANAIRDEQPRATGRFKKGDRVRVVSLDSTDRGFTTLRVGDTGTVLEDSCVPYVEFDRDVGGYVGHCGKPGHTYVVFESQLAYARPAHPMMAETIRMRD